MQETIVRARKLGGSLIVRVPKDIVDQKGIVEGETLKLKINKRMRKDWSGALKTLKQLKKEEELDEH